MSITRVSDPDPNPDLSGSRIFWLHREHFNVDTGPGGQPGQVAFRLIAAYDVIAAPDWCIAFPKQPWGEIWLIREGQVDLSQDGKRERIQTGEIAILTGGRSRQSLESAGKPLSILGFSFEAWLWNSLDFSALLDLPLRIAPQGKTYNHIVNLLETIVTELRDEHTLAGPAAQIYAHLAFIEVLRCLYPGQELEAHWRRKISAALSNEIAGVLEFIAVNYQQTLDIEALARVAHLSPQHFARKFKAAMGLSPMEYLRNLRLEKAQNLLAASEDSIGHVASQCGFEDAAHFSRLFKEHYGSSPLEFRRHARAFTVS